MEENNSPPTADPILQLLFEDSGNGDDGLVDIGQLMSQRRPVEWVVEGLIPRNSFLILAGEAKKGMKTTLATHLALCLANGAPFLGMGTKACKVAILNLEDGLPCILDRFYFFGARSGDTTQIKILVDEEQYQDGLEQAVQWGADVIIIDPLLELELSAGVKNENDNIQMGMILRGIRHIVRRDHTVVLLLHHSGAKSDMRGASALRGSIDGWLTIKRQKKNSTHRLAWWVRRAQEGYVDVDIKYVTEDDETTINIDCTGAPVLGDAASDGRDDDDDDDDEGSSMGVDTLARVAQALQDAEEPLSLNKLQPIAKARREALTEALELLEIDGLVAHEKKGWVWLLTDGGPQEKAEESGS